MLFALGTFACFEAEQVHESNTLIQNCVTRNKQSTIDGIAIFMQKFIFSTPSPSATDCVAMGRNSGSCLLRAALDFRYMYDVALGSHALR